MKISVALIVGAFILSGCTHCQMATFYKPSIEEGNRLHTDSLAPTYAGITINDVPFTIAVCGDKYLAPPGDTVKLCISLELDDSTTLRFSDPTVKLGVGALPFKDVPMASIEYEIFCRLKNGNRTCTSSEESPVATSVNKVSTVASVDRYAFDPRLEFHGAKDTINEGAWFGYRLTGKRRYYISTVPTPVKRGADLSVQLPEVILNGKVYTSPKLHFRAVTEDVCRLVPLA